MASTKEKVTTRKAPAKAAARRATSANPSTPAQYLAALPAPQRAAVAKLKRLLDEHLPKGFEGTVGYGMLAWVVPHELFPAGYHCDPSLPLPFINVAARAHGLSLYHMGLYDGPLLEWLRDQWPKHTAQKLDLGKCCLRLKDLDDVPWDLLAELATKMTPAQWIDRYRTNVR